MTKEKMIKEAWGLNYEAFSEHIDSDGWAIYPHFQKHEMVEDVRSLEFKENGSGFRPKTLQGIENNNGWININDNLPKEKGYYIMYNGENMVLIELNDTTNMITLREQFLKDGFTHYQPIVKPKPPIY